MNYEYGRYQHVSDLGSRHILRSGGPRTVYEFMVWNSDKLGNTYYSTPSHSETYHTVFALCVLYPHVPEKFKRNQVVVVLKNDEVIVVLREDEGYGLYLDVWVPHYDYDRKRVFIRQTVRAAIDTAEASHTLNLALRELLNDCHINGLLPNAIPYDTPLPRWS